MAKFAIPEDEYTLPEQTKKKKLTETEGIVQLSIKSLVMDEENEKIYGGTKEDIMNLSYEIKKTGFKGVILAYPIKPGTYMIESGHRRFMAAKEAGLNEIPVMLTEPPKSEPEKKIRLIKMNLHNRNYLPSVKAKEIMTLIDAYQEMYDAADEQVEHRTIVEQVAKDEELSWQSIEKYRSFSRIIPELKNIADEGVSWSALAGAATLPEQEQSLLALSIRTEKERLGGAENISRQWINSLIAKRKKALIEDPNDSSVKPKLIVRNRNAMKIIRNWSKDLNDFTNGNAVIKDKDKKEAIDSLLKMRACIDKKLAELQ